MNRFPINSVYFMPILQFGYHGNDSDDIYFFLLKMLQHVDSDEIITISSNYYVKICLYAMALSEHLQGLHVQ